MQWYRESAKSKESKENHGTGDITITEGSEESDESDESTKAGSEDMDVSIWQLK